MGIQLSQSIVSGEIDNSTLNAVQGHLVLCGRASAGCGQSSQTPDSVIRFSLSGNLSGLLAGRHLHFRSPAPEWPPTTAATGSSLSSPQIGVINSSDLKAAHDSSVSGSAGRLSLTGQQELSPEQQTYCLHLEWYGQNGLVIAAADDAEVVFADDSPAGSPISERPTAFRQHSCAEAPHTGVLIRPAVEVTVPESLWNYVREPVRGLIPEDLQLPDPCSVTDEESAWSGLRLILSQLAVMNIAFDICPHVTGMEAYMLLTETIFRTNTLHSNLAASGFIQHLASHEHCECCREEFQRRRRNQIDKQPF